MHRRSLIKKAALAGMAGATVAAEKALPQATGRARSILITSAHHRLAQLLADDLSSDHEVLLTSETAVNTRRRFQQSDLGHDAPTDELVRGMDAIVHVAEPLAAADLAVHIDHQTRCTYNLLLAAAQAGVQHVVYLSTLEVLAAYDSSFLVDERWAPRPVLTAPSLPKHLGEYTCREFARVTGLEITVLRLGTVTDRTTMDSSDRMSVSEQDVVRAVRLALDREPSSGPTAEKWSLFHISSGSPTARFRSAKANRILGYEPKY